MIGFFLGLAKGIFTRFLEPIWKWLWADFRHPFILALVIVVGAHWFIIDPRLRDQRDDARATLTAEKKAHAQTVTNYREAANEAQRLDTENAARVKAEQDVITQEIVNDFQTRLADARRRAADLSSRLRANASATAHSGSGRDAPMPSASDAAQGAYQTSGENRLSLPDALIATEQALQLDALIDWVEAQSAVDVNGQDQ